MNNEINDAGSGNQSADSPLFADIAWLVGIIAIMLATSTWFALSLRPDIGQVAVLWLPNGVLAVALLRNWGRIRFCFLVVFLFMIIGVVPAFKTNTIFSAVVLLSVDIIEAAAIAFGLNAWFGKSFRLNNAPNVAAFGAIAMVACALGGTLAAIASQFPIGPMPISTTAPLQVGVAWFTADLATYLLVSAPLLAFTGRGGRYIWSDLRADPVTYGVGALSVMVLTYIGFAMPNWLAQKTGLALGAGGLILIAFPLATYLAFKRGPAVAAVTGSAIGISAIYATMAGLGPFGKGDAAANVFDMQATLIVCVFSLLLIGAMGHEMRARSSALERALDEAIKLRQNRP